jgi:hypothetical protein
MADNSSLLRQLASRASNWHSTTGISQQMMARAIGMEPGNYSAFLKGKRGLGAESTYLLLKYVALPKREAVAKFSAPARSSKVVSFQSQGNRMYFDNDGWVPGLSGEDPYDPNSNDITDTPSADTTGPVWNQDLIDVLRETRGYHRQAVRAINSYIAKAKANAGITVPSGVSQKFTVANEL